MATANGLGDENLRKLDEGAGQDGLAQLHGHVALCNKGRHLHARLPHWQWNRLACLQPNASLADIHQHAFITIAGTGRRNPISGRLLHW